MDGTDRLVRQIRIETDRRTDPAMLTAGAAPNFGEAAVPHITSFNGLVGSLSKVYRSADEAIHHSLDNARAMRNDVGIMECLGQRMRLTSQLEWHVVAENPHSQEQAELVTKVTSIIRRIRRFQDMRKVLLEAIWYGKYAVQFEWRRVLFEDGHVYTMPYPAQNGEGNGWSPVNGDKLVFRWEDGTDPPVSVNGEELGPVGIRVNVARVPEKMRPYLAQTERGMAYFPPLWQRSLLCIHKHEVEDAAYEDPLNAASIHGVGIRSRIYWEWFQKQEMLAFLMEMLERSAAGIEIWEYPAGNDEARKACEAASLNRSGPNRNVITFPKPQDETAALFDVRHVFWDTSGAQVIKDMLENYYGHRIKRFILGQTLSSEADATGLGSGVADIHLDTLMQIVTYDAGNLEETLTHEFLRRIVDFNFPHAANIHLRFELQTESTNTQDVMSSFQIAHGMGARIKESDVLKLIGATEPTQDDVVLPSPRSQGNAAGGLPSEQEPQQDGVSTMRDAVGTVVAALKSDATQDREEAL